MSFIPGKSRTKVVPEGRRFQGRYYDETIKRWFDLGDPRDTEEEARALVAEFNKRTEPSVEHDPRVTVWADGFGRWRARVSKHAAGPLIAARRAIRDELMARSEPTPVHQHWWMHLERDEVYDEGDTVVYAEPQTNPDQCTVCTGTAAAHGIKEDG